MSEVKRYKPADYLPGMWPDKAGGYVEFKDFDDAQSELSALREELAHFKGLSEGLANDLRHAGERATAAEHRNATITTLLREGLEEYKNGDDWIERVIEVLRDQPTESGASE